MRVFLVNKNIKNRLYSIFQDIAPDSISICDDKAIIELEMFMRKKNSWVLLHHWRNMLMLLDLNLIK